MRVLGCDPGERRIGLAISVGTSALPLSVIERSDGWVEAIRAAVDHYGVELMVVGVPFALSGSMTASTTMARTFIAEVTAAIKVPVVEMDERFSSRAAERSLSAAGVSMRRQRGRIDDLAAADILQRYLDRAVDD
ncbi:MAG: Holliday junction resolvase RuvX [Ferrimicrobium sp.]|jgi:putative Holliday junction resolvase|nr:Holliday junction resolvase RuvX [Ferrimicrobium sp.]